ncbi:beta-1,3-galactosyl-O-glycosyl-glycoprotein beta-1,6-N-acetylglucosaminyltransferase [Austrofundulus limnaeus]|uniref:Beta-1,3-galactosyl-O-glycosyl-glycoprotein beta-1,6-N-acetylglucosaminyltransferase-like n=1 Tax=Austrofundulus limnaeus TaxID=52670 RepID=A0A2I4BYM7_AUSLI|nr:PREDICTED: beta-1,3-galactosyl-O-glycosyl-glycoprotein beta-1,6-N-acetylglucosaminyltransferase-like [Austrofundulus limnaeus]XP_013872810.1 PREDICTED: beta-1,3-galactosyl-O-glycosyl-glycoprotein beta-1,6-N-acetylglucosaminyltransferase-like [Austrofundulus limnaeus]
MQPLKRGCVQFLLKLSVGLVSLGTFYLVRQRTDRTLGYRWLEYTEDDGGPEKACNCSGILQGEQEALQQVKLLTITRDFQKNIQIPDEYYIYETQDCRKFKLKRKYLPFPLSKEEEDFPLAYSMVIHHKVQNFERLLRAIYAPQNIYCVHVDKKAKPSVTAAIQAITSCFPNVFLVSQAVEVVYAGWPRVQADLNCMADLYSASKKWKYFINLCGQDFPLKTNLEMVRMLRSMRGSNSLESETVPADKKWRISYVHEIINGDVKTTKTLKNPAPFNLPIKSGGAYIVVSRGFVRSVLEDTRIEMLINWFKDTYSPDEFLWATIQRIPGVPGSKWPNRKYDQTDINALARLVKWENHEGSQDSESAVYPKCQGNHVRAVCVYGAGDLQWLLEHLHLFANKFDTETDPVAIYCLEKYLRHKALAEAVGESV